MGDGGWGVGFGVWGLGSQHSIKTTREIKTAFWWAQTVSLPMHRLRVSCSEFKLSASCLEGRIPGCPGCCLLVKSHLLIIMSPFGHKCQQNGSKKRGNGSKNRAGTTLQGPFVAETVSLNPQPRNTVSLSWRRRTWGRRDSPSLRRLPRGGDVGGVQAKLSTSNTKMSVQILHKQRSAPMAKQAHVCAKQMSVSLFIIGPSPDSFPDIIGPSSDHSKA